MKHSIYNIFLVGFLSFLSSCNPTKQVAGLEKQSLPANYRGSESSDSISVGNISRDAFFKDPFLTRLIDSALLKNTNALLAEKNVASAQWMLSAARLGNLPTLSLQGTASTNRFSDNSLNGISASSFFNQHHTEDYNLQAMLSWEADIWGKIHQRKQSALASYLQQVEVKKTVQTLVVANVTKAYINLLVLDKQLEIARKNLAIRSRTENILQLQYESGQVTSLAVKQAKALKLEAAQLLPQLEEQLTIQENALSHLTGKFPDTIYRDSSLTHILSKEQTLKSGVPALLLQNRPDVMAAELNVRKAIADQKVARADLYPSLKINAAGGFDALDFDNWFNTPGSLFGSLMGSLTAPLINGKKLKAAYNMAKIEREKSLIQFKETLLSSVNEVSDALVQLQKIDERLNYIKERETTLKQAVGEADMLFKQGMANYLEVISAQSNLLQSELDKTNTEKALWNSKIELYRALGGGWK
ncbi:TolC family protein [Zhouia sp. PK063]|uniref:TolC family protein n=1 Tax=Zhouia sp. PK063 TaxID=3373602 RepID=UPI003799DAA8